MSKVSSGMTGKFSTIPGRTSEKFPEEYLERSLDEARVGEHFVVDASALVVDLDLNCWLRPDALIEPGTVLLNSSAPYLLVTREERGYVVSLHSIKGRKWRPGPRPTAYDGKEWVRVIELKY